MIKLSDTALILLGQAAEREDRLAMVPPKLPARWTPTADIAARLTSRAHPYDQALPTT